MKKADIVAVAKENGLELDINLTKAKLLDAWDIHLMNHHHQAQLMMQQQ